MSSVKPLLTAYVVRHGQTYFNAEDITQGQSDSELTPLGIEQANGLGEKLKDVHFDTIFSSDLGRAQKTAEILKRDRTAPLYQSLLLRERKFGIYENKPFSFFRMEQKEMLEKYEHLTRAERRTFRFADDVETEAEISSRMFSFFDETFKTHQGQTILVVSHGAIMKAFLNALDWTRDAEIPSSKIQNMAFVKVAFDGEHFEVLESEGIMR